MATIDSLDIKISAQANSASASIDKLVGKLNRVSAALSGVNARGLAAMGSGVNKLANAMNNFANNTKTADFSRLGRNIKALGDMDTSGFSSIAGALKSMSNSLQGFSGVSKQAEQIGTLAGNLSKLGYKSINNAITNLPALTSGLNNLMTTLSRAPRVSNNVIQMTNALANLASQGGRVGTASRTLVNGLNNSTNAMNRATKSSMSLAAAFGKFYATWWAAIRGIKKLWGSIESSMDYVEVLNYFDAAFTQVAEKADYSRFEEMGGEAGKKAAEEYARSFSERAKELTTQMTGFAVTEKGTLEATGMPSLGLDPSQLMQYQAMFGQMASSMGVASETSLKLSRALTEIGADLASVKNMDFDKVWNDMASGLAGMSRTLDKYGVNIRNVNLQQKLTELGINANITALNQNDKALLRTIILLDSTRYAWGDLADTINQPANQLRLIEANFKNLGRTIGGLFLPLVQKVLPYINGLVIALQRLFTWVGNLLGIDLSKVTSSVGDTDFSGLIEDTDDLTDGLNSATKAAEKLKKGVRDFDELKVITTQDDSDKIAGLGAGLTDGLLDAAFEDALSEYQEKWDEAFANMENRAQELADKVEKFFEPIKKIIQDFAVGDFFQAGQDVSNLVVSITDFFARAIDSVDWYGIGQKIGDFLAGVDWLKILKSVGNLIWQAIKASIELWKGSFDAAPIETTIITAIGLLKFTGLGAAILKAIKNSLLTALGAEKGTSLGIALLKWVGRGITSVATKIGLTFEGLFSGMSFSEALASGFGGSASTIASVGTTIAGIASTVGGAILAITNFVKMLIDGFDWLNEILMVVGTALAAVGAVVLGAPAAVAAVVAGIVAAVGTIVVVVHDNWDAICEWFSGVGEWINTNVIEPIVGFFKGLWERISGFFTNLWNDITTIWNTAVEWFSSNIVEPIVGFFAGLGTRIQQVFEGLWIIIQAVWKVVSEWFNTNVIIPVIGFFQGLWENVSSFFSQLWEDIVAIWQTVSEWFNVNVVTPVTDFFREVWENVSGFFSNLWEDIKEVWSVVSEWFSDNIINPVSNAFKIACEAIGGFFSNLWSGIKKGVVGAMNVVIGGIEGAINWIVDGINGIIGGFNKVVNWAAGVIGADWGGVDLVPKVSLGRINVDGYELGGFPKEYSLFMAGEHGRAEMLGTVGGQTAVAGGTEITGIRDAVYSTSQQEIELLRQQNQLLQAILKKEYGISKDDIGRAAQDYNRDYMRRTGRPAYSF